MNISSATMTEAFVCQDTFVSGLGDVEDIGGGCFRFTFYARQHLAGAEELIVVAKLVAPKDAVPPALLMAAKAIGFSLLGEAGLRLGVN